MGMKMKVSGIPQVKAMIAKDSREATKAAWDQMLLEAEEIKDLSVAYSPVDEGDLEGAHKVVKDGAGNARKVTIVVRDFFRGVNVGAYVERIHEGIGWSKLGPKSRAKAAATGKRVGRKFLERAFKSRLYRMEQRIRGAVRRAL